MNMLNCFHSSACLSFPVQVDEKGTLSIIIVKHLGPVIMKKSTRIDQIKQHKYHQLYHHLQYVITEKVRHHRKMSP